MISKTLTVVNPSGLHLRPAGVLSQTAMKFKSDITIECGEKKIIAKSVLNVVAVVGSAPCPAGPVKGCWYCIMPGCPVVAPGRPDCCGPEAAGPGF